MGSDQSGGAAQVARLAGISVAPGSAAATVLLCVGVALSMLLFAGIVGPWTSERGIAGPLVADAERPLLAGGATVAALAAGTLLAILIGRILNAVVGLFVLGCGIGLLAMRTGASADFAFGGSTLLEAGIEMAVWTVLLGAACHLIFRFSGPLLDMPPTHEPEVDSPFGPLARRSWIGAIGGLAMLWLVAASPDKGQAIGAAVLGGFATGAIGRGLAPRTPPVYLACALPAAFAVNLLFLAFTAKGDLAAAFVDGSFPRLLRVMPVDLAAGSLMGVSMGFGVMRSFVSDEE